MIESINNCRSIQVLKSPILWALLVTYISLSDGLKSSKKRPENGGDISVIFHLINHVEMIISIPAYFSMSIIKLLSTACIHVLR